MSLIIRWLLGAFKDYGHSGDRDESMQQRSNIRKDVDETGSFKGSGIFLAFTHAYDG